jgi:hypothetical protein
MRSIVSRTAIFAQSGPYQCHSLSFGILIGERNDSRLCGRAQMILRFDALRL